MKILTILLFFGVSSFVLVHATEYSGAEYYPRSSSVVVNFPEINVEKEAEVGESIVFAVDKVGTKQLTMLHDISTTVAVAWTDRKLEIYTGDGTAEAQNKEGIFFKFDKSKNSTADKIYDEKVYLFMPRDESKEFEVCKKVLNTFFNCGKVGRLIENVDFKAGESFQLFDRSFKQELIYTGTAQGVITLTYREFKDNIARASFTQDLKYDINNDDTIGFKGSRIKILKASNSGIKFKVIQHLRRPE